MWSWITICLIIVALILIVEESIYYFWNRYLYGLNIEWKRKWKQRLKWSFRIFKRNRPTQIQEPNQKERSL